MKNPLLALILSAALTAPAFAVTDAAKTGKAPTAQQQRMKDCNAEAKTKGLKGDARKTFMKSCLKGESEGTSSPGGSEKQKAQREKMASCNSTANAQGLKGDGRRKFMSDCLKKD